MTAIRVVRGSVSYESSRQTFEDELSALYEDGFVITHVTQGEHRVVAYLEKES